jgi:hypothetical protein
MPIGEKSSETRIGRSCSGHVQKPHVQCCSINHGLFWRNTHQMEQGQSWTKTLTIGAERGSS